MDKDTLAMARRNYGYGRWDAPYWFIGPEQGMADHRGNNLALRVKVWHDLGRRELNDCRRFHCLIDEKQWHCKEPVSLQGTWRPLMLLMMSFLGRPVDNDSLPNRHLRKNYHLRDYQRDRWGTVDEKVGETCVIELSGLAAPNLQENPDPGIYLLERIKVIARNMRDHKPELAVMYGRVQTDSWNAIAGAVAGRDFPVDTFAPDMPRTNVLIHETTILVWTPAPTARGLGNEYWVRLGRRLRDLKAAR